MDTLTSLKIKGHIQQTKKKGSSLDAVSYTHLDVYKRQVLELKRFSRDYSIPIIGISSFNRDNYTAPVNMASFKESGAIESVSYTHLDVYKRQEEAPADLTKWDIVEAGRMDFYGGLFCGMDVSEGEYLAELEDFLTEFRELADAIIADIEKLYLTGKKQLQPLPVKGHKPLKDIASLPLEDWSSTVFSLSLIHI